MAVYFAAGGTQGFLAVNIQGMQHLGGNQVGASYHFRYGVLYLNASIHFEEKILIRVLVEQELHSSRPLI